MFRVVFSLLVLSLFCHLKKVENNIIMSRDLSDHDVICGKKVQDVSAQTAEKT